MGWFARQRQAYGAIRAESARRGLFVSWWESRAVMGGVVFLVGLYAQLWWAVALGGVVGLFSLYKARQKRRLAQR